MANGVNLCFTIFLTVFLFSFPIITHCEPRAPCYFIFGDSLADNGNNNELHTNAKANYLPYGIDFPEGPTGRFSNGRNIVDFIAKDLGFNTSIPPYATVKDEDILRGVNYASGGAGILPETGKQLGDVIYLNRQLANHQTAISRISSLQKNKSFTNEYLSKCIYTVGMGSNDYINNYFAPQFYDSSRLFTPKDYAETLIRQYSQQLETLHKLSARKIAVFELGKIGCAPAQVIMFGANKTACVDKINNAVNLFNDKLKRLVGDLNTKLDDARFVMISSNAPTDNIPIVPGLALSIIPCCKISTEQATRGQCIPGRFSCINRLQHVFFDGFHPSESSNYILAKVAYNYISLLL